MSSLSINLSIPSYFMGISISFLPPWLGSHFEDFSTRVLCFLISLCWWQFMWLLLVWLSPTLSFFCQLSPFHFLPLHSSNQCVFTHNLNVAIKANLTNLLASRMVTFPIIYPKPFKMWETKVPQLKDSVLLYFYSLKILSKIHLKIFFDNCMSRLTSYIQIFSPFSSRVTFT